MTHLIEYAGRFYFVRKSHDWWYEDEVDSPGGYICEIGKEDHAIKLTELRQKLNWN